MSFRAGLNLKPITFEHNVTFCKHIQTFLPSISLASSTISAMKSIGVNLLKQFVEEELSGCIGISLR